MSRWLVDNDYDVTIRDHIKSIIQGSTEALYLAEKMAISQARSYLSAYDTDIIFTAVPNWSSTTNYATGSYVQHNGVIYKALSANTNNPPPSANWIAEDSRNSHLVMIIVDITLYHCFAKINPRNIQELRIERYKEAILWLKDLADGVLSADLPMKSTTTNNIFISGSNEKTSKRW
jgi:hypothetical protein